MTYPVVFFLHSKYFSQTYSFVKPVKLSWRVNSFVPLAIIFPIIAMKKMVMDFDRIATLNLTFNL